MKTFIDRIYAFVERTAMHHRLQQNIGKGVTPIPAPTTTLPPVSPQVATSLASWGSRHITEAQRAFIESLSPGVWTRAVRICYLRLWREKKLSDWNLAAADAYQMLLAERYHIMLIDGPGKPLAATDFTHAENAYPPTCKIPVVAPDPATLTRIGRHMTGPHRTLRLVSPVPEPVEQHADEAGSGINDDTEESPAIVILKHMAYTG